MKSVFVLMSCLVLLAQTSCAHGPPKDSEKPRTPAQNNGGYAPFPPITPTPGVPDSTGGGATTFAHDDVVAAGTNVNAVYCLFGAGSGYNMNAAGNDVRIGRVSAGGEMRYEIFKGQRFLGACPSIQVQSR